MIEMRRLDHQDSRLTPLTEPQVIYQTRREVELALITSDGDELVLLWGERSAENPIPERVFHVLYLNLDGQPVRGPYLLPPLTFWNQQISAMYDPDRDEVITAWLKGLSFSEIPGTSALEFNATSVGIEQPCATSAGP